MNYRIFVLSIIVLAFILSSCNDKTTNPEPDKSKVIIGTQVWMSKNLDVVHYRNGDSILQVTDPIYWNNLTTGAWCYYNNDLAMGAIYGKLYNWYAVNDPRGLAPDGWHVPSDAEWTALSDYLGGESVAGDKLKETGTTHWQSPNTDATNETGFSALPAGYRNLPGSFSSIGSDCVWWSSTMSYTTNAWLRDLIYKPSYLVRSSSSKKNGFSVRCIKD